MNQKWLLLLSIGFGASLLASEGTLHAEQQIKIDGDHSAQTLTLRDLKKRLPVSTLTVDDPVYKIRKTYEGFWLKDVLKLVQTLPDFEKGAGKDHEIIFHCRDGYSPTTLLSNLKNHQALLAFRDTSAPKGQNWVSFTQGKAQITPAPFYLVWDVSGESYPWPYQLVGMELINFADKFSKIYPEDVKKDSSAFRGFRIFKDDCLRCHSINLQGGVLGPELNIPKNILEYWTRSNLIEFIKNSESFRARSKMPSFPNLSSSQIEDVLSYLEWAKDNKKN
jgi:mono/diheme cytochrome c family protein